MTWESLIDRTITSFSPDVSRTKVRKYLEEAEEDFALETNCYIKNWGYMPNAGDDVIDLPEDFVALVGQVEFKTRTLKPFSTYTEYSRYRSDSTLKTGNPEYYFIRGQKMYLVPALTASDLVTFSYAAKPTQLNDDASAYKKLKYDNLSSDNFYHGDSIKLLSQATGTVNTVLGTATVEDVIDITQKSGYLIVSSLAAASGQTIVDNCKIVNDGEEEQMWNTSFGGYASLLTNWQTLGLGGIALLNGVAINHATAGDKPVIPDAYHRSLTNYAKSMLSDDQGDSQRSNLYLNRYTDSKLAAKQQVSGKGISGPHTVTDAYGSTFI